MGEKQLLHPTEFGSPPPLLRTSSRGEVVDKLPSYGTIKHRRPSAELHPANLNSYDYNKHESKVQQAFDRAQTNPEHRKEAFARWAYTLLIGVATALAGFCVTEGSLQITTVKIDILQTMMSDGYDAGLTFLSYLGMNLMLVTVAAYLVVYVEPIAGGSGIPEIKSALNGVKFPHIAKARTLMVKCIGVICSVSGGLPVGKEGPMVHIGAIIAAGVSQRNWVNRRLGLVSKFFRNDKEKVAFISCGAAAGLAAAFGAPIGGLLFSLEEGSSFWNQRLTWRAFFCCMTTTFALNFLLSGVQTDTTWGRLNQPGMFSFGDFEQNTYQTFAVYEIPFFIGIGVCGGLLGALFTGTSRRLIRWRLRHVRVSTVRTMGEAWLFVLLTSLCSFFIPYAWTTVVGSCLPVPPPLNSPGVQAKTYVQFFCPDGYYNEMATIYFTPSENAIKQIFHSNMEFGLDTLGVFFIVYYSLSCWTNGIAVPSGLFVPNLVAGAAMGRFIGQCLHAVLGEGMLVNDGIYALVGSAALVGGMSRMTVSLAVMLVEATGDIQYGLPLMAALMAAKWVGDYFNEGLYDAQIHLNRYPMLEWFPPKDSAFLLAMHVMNSPVQGVHEVEKVGVVLQLLRTSTHNGFVVTPEREKGLYARLRARDDFGAKYGDKLFGGGGTGSSHSHSDSEDGDTSSHSHSNGAPNGVAPPPKRKTLRSLSFAGGGGTSDFFEQVGAPLRGFVLRKHLSCLLLEKNAFFNHKPKPYVHPARVSIEDIEKFYPHYPPISEIEQHLTDDDLDKWVDVTPLMDPTPTVIQANASVSQAFRLFRTMGLRHLAVVSQSNDVVGMITRHDLTEHACKVHLNKLFDPKFVDRPVAPGSPSQQRTTDPTVHTFVRNLDTLKPRFPSSN